MNGLPGQKWGAAALYSEARIGELLPSAEENRRAINTDIVRDNVGRVGGKKILPEGVDSRRAFAARAIANNPETVEEVIKEAEGKKARWFPKE